MRENEDQRDRKKKKEGKREGNKSGKDKLFSHLIHFFGTFLLFGCWMLDLHPRSNTYYSISVSSVSQSIITVNTFINNIIY